MDTLENWRKKQHLREVLLSYFFAKKTAAESHRLLVGTYGKHALSETQCFEWFQRFKSGNFDIKDKERPGQPKRFGDNELKALLDENPCRTQEELAKILNVTQATVSKRLKTMGMVLKPEFHMQYKLEPSDIVPNEDSFTSESLTTDETKEDCNCDQAGDNTFQQTKDHQFDDMKLLIQNENALIIPKDEIDEEDFEPCSKRRKSAPKYAKGGENLK